MLKIIRSMIALAAMICGVEISAYIQRTVRLVLWVAALAFFSMNAVIAAAATIVVALWEQRLLAAALVALLFLAAAGVAAWRVKRLLHSTPGT